MVQKERKALPVDAIRLPREDIVRVIRQNTKFDNDQVAAFTKEWEAGRRTTGGLAKACNSTAPTCLKIKKLLLEADNPALYEKATGKTSTATRERIEEALGPEPPPDPPAKLSPDEVQELLDQMIREAHGNEEDRRFENLVRLRMSISPDWREQGVGQMLDPEKMLGPQGLALLGEKLTEVLTRLAVFREQIPGLWAHWSKIFLNNPLDTPPAAVTHEKPDSFEVTTHVDRVDTSGLHPERFPDDG